MTSTALLTFFIVNLKAFLAAIKKAYFLFFEVRLAFILLRQVFTKAPIFRYFDLKYHIWDENNISS